MKFRWLLYLVFTGVVCSCQADRKDPATITPVLNPGYETLDSLLDDYVSEEIIQGAVALVARQGEIVYHRAAGFANIEEKRQERISDIFRIASMTKQVTSVAAMILYDQGKFELDDPLGMYIPGFTSMDIVDEIHMEDTHFELPVDKRNRLVDVYRSSEQGVVLSEESYGYPLKDSLVYLSGGADLSCTAYDYYLFCRMMLNDGECNGVRILQPGTAQLMRETHLETGDYDMGLGFSVLSEKTSVTDARTVGTYSGGGYFGTSYWIDPEEDLVAILMLQVYPFKNYGIYKKFEDAIYQVIGQE